MTTSELIQKLQEVVNEYGADAVATVSCMTKEGNFIDQSIEYVGYDSHEEHILIEARLTIFS